MSEAGEGSPRKKIKFKINIRFFRMKAGVYEKEGKPEPEVTG